MGTQLILSCDSGNDMSGNDTVTTAVTDTKETMETGSYTTGRIRGQRTLSKTPDAICRAIIDLVGNGDSSRRKKKVQDPNRLGRGKSKNGAAAD